MDKSNVVEAETVLQHADQKVDDLGDALQLLCNKYGCWVRMPVRGMTEEKYKLLVYALLPFAIRCRWVQLSEQERRDYSHFQPGSSWGEDRLHFEGVV